MKTLKDFFSVVDLQTILVTMLAIGSTYACEYYKLQADIPTSLIGLAVVFPIVFSISAAYRRREEALKYLGSLRAHAVALYYTHRDWVPDEDNQINHRHVRRAKDLIENMFHALHAYLRPDGRNQDNLVNVYEGFSALSQSLETLRKAKVTNSEISRANQYLSKTMIEFERLKNIADYRTPVTLRAYSRVFLNIFPIAFGPYFAWLSTKSESFPYVGYLVAALYALVLVSLDNLQEDLEDPFDHVGSDDICLDTAEDYSNIIKT